MVGSKPSHPRYHTVELAGWDVKAKRGRVDLILYGNSDEITTWKVQIEMMKGK